MVHMTFPVVLLENSEFECKFSQSHEDCCELQDRVATEGKQEERKSILLSKETWRFVHETLEVVCFLEGDLINSLQVLRVDLDSVSG